MTISSLWVQTQNGLKTHIIWAIYLNISSMGLLHDSHARCAEKCGWGGFSWGGKPIGRGRVKLESRIWRDSLWVYHVSYIFKQILKNRLIDISTSVRHGNMSLEIRSSGAERRGTQTIYVHFQRKQNRNRSLTVWNRIYNDNEISVIHKRTKRVGFFT